MPSLRPAVQDLALLTLGAFLYSVAAPPYEWAAAAWLALAPLFLVIRNKTPKAAFVAGLLYGVLFCAGIAYWVYFAVSTYFSFFFPLDLLVTFLSYSFFVGIYTGLVASLSCVLIRRGSPLLCWGGIPALWVSGEFARSYLFSGFSWELLGYTQYRFLPLIQIADITGVYGLSFLMALSGYVVAESVVCLRRWQQGLGRTMLPWSVLGSLAVGVAVVLLYGTWRLQQYRPVPSTPAVTVALVRGNVPNAQRWQRTHYASALLKYLAVTRQGIRSAQPDLIVWPEFAVGFYLDREPPLRAQLTWLTHSVNAALLLGAPRAEESETGKRYYNSAHLISPEGTLLGTYDKRRLLPFAEYRPLALPVPLHHSREYPSEFTAGDRSTVFAVAQSSFGVLICYESTYPHLARAAVQNGAQFLVNISNDSWLVAEGGAAAAQHFSMTVFRAVENKRPLVRAAAFGISGFVDPTGSLRHLSADGEGVLMDEVFPRDEMTVYARYGDWFAYACAGFALVAFIRTRRQQ